MSLADSPGRSEALAVLGLAPGATRDEVVRAYRQLIKATHPDATGRVDREADRRFSMVTDAYRWLTETGTNALARDTSVDTRLSGSAVPAASTPSPVDPAKVMSSRPAPRSRLPLFAAGPVSVRPTPDAPSSRGGQA